MKQLTLAQFREQYWLSKDAPRNSAEIRQKLVADLTEIDRKLAEKLAKIQQERE